MAPWPSQQKDQEVPQLSCALCRDRKLKCDKLDPCTNCMSSGVVCVPIHRPRLPRGRHARRARPKTSSVSTSPPPPATLRQVESSISSTVAPAGVHGDLGARIDRLESLVLRGEVAKTGIDAETNGMQELLFLVRKDRPATTTTQFFETIGQDLCHRISKLESLVQETGGTSTEPWSGAQIGGTEQLWSSVAVRTTESGEKHQLPAPTLSSPARWSPRPSSDFWVDLMDHEMYGQKNASEQPSNFADEDVTSLRRVDSVNNGIGGLRLLGADNSLSLSLISLPRDKIATSTLCQVYLQNVDPIIKILHRPSLSKWMLDGAQYLGSPEGDSSVRALESAVCYAAANTMTESQCQAAFQKGKAGVVTMYRKMCEDAIERSGLLTTRDMIVLQAFVLYLIGRRSEEKGTAIWALVALVVRLTNAMSLNQEPGESTREGESFFQQQMRLRLWLTVCLMDLQASFAEASEPLINHQDAATAVPHVRHINDSDFDVDTTHAVDSREELTDTTFALVTYRVQVAGRLLNFASPESNTSGASSTISHDSAPPAPPFGPEERQKLVRQFKQEAFGLLHYCDPESSPYAWFTWHSTQCIVSAIRLSELLPHRCGGTGSRIPSLSPRAEGDRDMLQRTLQNLEKAQLIHSDPRGDGFRWYITTPWLALSTAIMGCKTCTDMALVRRAWPVIEASYTQYEEFALLRNCQSSQTPLAQLMSETREKLAPLLLQGETSLDDSQCVNKAGDSTKPPGSIMTTHVSHGVGSTPIEPSLTAAGSLTVDSAMEFEASFVVSGQPFRQQSWNPTAMSMDYTPGIEDVLPTPELYNPLQPETFEQPWMTTNGLSLNSPLGEISDK